MKKIIVALSLVALVMSAGCATVNVVEYESKPDPTALVEQQRMVERIKRIKVVTYTVATAAAEYCGERAASLGFSMLTNVHLKSQVEINALWHAAKIDDKPRILIVLPESGAARAGLRAGDRVLRIGGRELTRPMDVKDFAEGALVEVVVERDGREVAVNVPTREACHSTAAVGLSEKIDAAYRDDHVFVSAGMMDALQSDDELAYVVAFYMAYNNVEGSGVRAAVLEGGIASKEVLFYGGIANANPAQSVGSVLGLFVLIPATMAVDAAYRDDADKHAINMVNMAGYDASVLPAMWKRLTEREDTENFDHPVLQPSAARKEAMLNQIAALPPRPGHADVVPVVVEGIPAGAALE